MGREFGRDSRHKFVCLQGQSQGGSLLLSQSGAQTLGVECSGHSLAVPLSLRISSTSSPAGRTIEIQGRVHQPHTGGSILTQKALVCSPSVAFSSASCGAACQAVSSISGADSLSLPGHASVNGLATDAQLLRSNGLSDRVVETLLQSRKPVTCVFYAKIW